MEDLQQTTYWVAVAKEGDARGFSKLYERIATSLYAWARMRLRSRSQLRIDPEDLVQEVWCRAWRKLPDLDDEVPIRPWLFRIAKNILLEVARASQKPGARGRQGETTSRFALENAPDDATAISKRLMRDETLRSFDLLVSAMSKDDQALIQYCGLEGLPHSEAAERLGLSTEVLTKRWQRLRARLKENPLPGGLLAED